MTFSTLYEACHNFFGWIIFPVVVRYANAEQLVNADNSKNCLPMSSNGLLLCMIEFLGMTTILDSICSSLSIWIQVYDLICVSYGYLMSDHDNSIVLYN